MHDIYMGKKKCTMVSPSSPPVAKGGERHDTLKKNSVITAVIKTKKKNPT